MSMVVIMAAAGLAFDIGRFYSEKRFLQNAADAGALAVANALIRGETNTDAEAEGRDVLTRNLIGSPTGTPGVVATTPEYESGHMGEAEYLTSGILISGGEVRVAIKSDVGYTFGRVVGFGTEPGRWPRPGEDRRRPPADRRSALHQRSRTVRRRASRRAMGIPTSSRTWSRPRTPHASAARPTASLRSTPNPGSAFNASDPGRRPGEPRPDHRARRRRARRHRTRRASAASSRSTSATSSTPSPPSNVFYNGVTAGTNANTLKAMEAGWVATGYPGPDFPPVTTPPDPNDQVGIIDGNSSGIVVDAINDRYDPGAEILAAVYSGTVSSIPDFAYAVPSTATINTNQNRNGSVTMAVTKNASFTGVVATSAFPNWGETAHPWGSTLTPLSFSPSPLTPRRHGDLDDLPDQRCAAGRVHRVDPGSLVQPGPARPFLPGRHLDRQRQPRLLDERRRCRAHLVDRRERDHERRRSARRTTTAPTSVGPSR